jgi:hypothetical protein
MIAPIYPSDSQLAVSPYFSQTPIYTPEPAPAANVTPAAPLPSPSDSIDISLEARVRSLDSTGLTLSQIAALTGVAEQTVQFYRGILPANPTF